VTAPRPDPPTEWEYRVFIAVAEYGSYEAAARRLAPFRGSYSRQAVQRIINKIQNYVGEKLLEKVIDRGLALTVAGDRVLQEARQVVALYERIEKARTRPGARTLACSPHHTHFVALAEDRLRHPDGTPGFEVEYLSQRDRGEQQFMLGPLARLMRDELQLIIGPPIRKDFLRSTHLYESRLEAMVDRDYPADRLPLASLVADFTAYLQPRDVRARRLLEDAIMAAGITDPGPAVRVAMETYETATSVMRLRTEDPRAGGRRRVVVVPSDVALAYKAGMEFGGRGADRFTWVPVVDSAGAPLRQETCVTVRAADATALRPVVDALRAGVDALNQGPHRLSGAAPVPAQRT